MSVHVLHTRHCCNLLALQFVHCDVGKRVEDIAKMKTNFVPNLFRICHTLKKNVDEIFLKMLFLNQSTKQACCIQPTGDQYSISFRFEFYKLTLSFDG